MRKDLARMRQWLAALQSLSTVAIQRVVLAVSFVVALVYTADNGAVPAKAALTLSLERLLELTSIAAAFLSTWLSEPVQRWAVPIFAALSIVILTPLGLLFVETTGIDADEMTGSYEFTAVVVCFGLLLPAWQSALLGILTLSSWIIVVSHAHAAYPYSLITFPAVLLLSVLLSITREGRINRDQFRVGDLGSNAQHLGASSSQNGTQVAIGRGRRLFEDKLWDAVVQAIVALVVAGLLSLMVEIVSRM